MDQSSANRLSKVHPALGIKVKQLIANLAALGMDVRVTQGLRTFAEQEALFAQGRSRPGKRVTNARGGQSNHNYGLAVDLCPFVAGKADWNDTAKFRVVGREAKKLGLEWGGDWRFVDMPHVQLPGMSVKECQYAFSQGGLARVWQRMNEIMRGAKPAVFVPKEDELLEFGDKGPEVKKLQENLASLGFLRPHEIDGDFGKITKNAVIGFQRQHNLTADGIVGDGTKAKLNSVLAAKTKLVSDIREEELPFKVPQPSAPPILVGDPPAELFVPNDQKTGLSAAQFDQSDLSENSGGVTPSQAVEIKQTVSKETSAGEVSSEISKKNEQDVNQTEKIPGPEPYNGIGFGATIKQDLAVAGIGNGGLQGVAEYAEKAQTLPEWAAAVLIKIAYVVLVISIAWLTFRAIHYLVDRWQQNQRAKTKALINTEITRKNMEWE